MGWVTWFVEDYEAAKRFYTSAMGFKISDRIVWVDGEKDATFFTVIAFLTGSDAAFGDIPPGTFNHLMLQGRSINDVGIAYDRVETWVFH